MPATLKIPVDESEAAKWQGCFRTANVRKKVKIPLRYRDISPGDVSWGQRAVVKVSFKRNCPESLLNGPC